MARGGEKRAGFHGGVVRDDHARNAGDIADAGDSTGGGDAAPLLVHFVGGPKLDLEKRRTGIEQPADALAREQSTHLVLAILAGFAAALAQNAFFPRDGGAAFAQTFRRRSRRSRHDRERLTPREGRNQARVA